MGSMCCCYQIIEVKDGGIAVYEIIIAYRVDVMHQKPRIDLITLDTQVATQISCDSVSSRATPLS